MELAAIAAVLTAMGGVIKLILTHLERQREGFEKFMGNHISHMSKSVEHNSTAIEANTLVLRAIAQRLVTEEERRVAELEQLKAEAPASPAARVDIRVDAKQ